MKTYKVYDLEWLRSEMSSGTRQKFVYFWGHRGRADKQLTKACFSQWWTSSFEVEGCRYATAEHWMMAEKARLFRAEDICAEILKSDDPGKAKALGRQVLNFDQEIWNQNKYEIAVQGNLHKFSQHKDLGEFLKNTGKRILVEASPVDKIWGVGLEQKDPMIEKPSNWKGQNMLGFALMSVRDLIS
ncbi:MAG: NADAR family protein [Litorimonas sp.]